MKAQGENQTIMRQKMIDLSERIIRCADGIDIEG